MNLVNLTDKKILVTGASSGIGRACAILISKLGANVILVARREDKLKETLSMMESSNRHMIIPCNISDVENISTLVSKIGKIDGLVHSAGVAPMCPVGFIDSVQINSVFKINYYSFLELIKHYSKTKNRNSIMSVVAISSVSASVGWAGGSVYCGSKGALSATVRALAVELASKRIRVNAVSPSNIKTPLYEKGAAEMNDEESMQGLIAKQPLGLGTPEMVANVVAFLLSEASSFITGVDLHVDGGYLAQ